MTKNIKDWTDLSLDPTGINAHNIKSGYSPTEYIPAEVGAGEGADNIAAHQKGVNRALKDAVGDAMTVSQVAHGLSVLTPVYHNGTIWTPGRANNLATLAEYVVIEVLSVDEFRAARFGRFMVPAHGKAILQHYLGDSAPGVTISTDTAYYSEPVFFPEDANWINVNVRRPPNRVLHPNLNVLRGLYKGSPGDLDNDFDLSTDFKVSLPSGALIDMSPADLVNTLIFRDGAFVFGGSGYTISAGVLTFTADGGGPLLENEEIELRTFTFN